MDPLGRATDSVLTQRVFQRLVTDAAARLSFSPELSTHSYCLADFSHLFRPSRTLRPAAKRGLYRPPARLRHKQADAELKFPPLVPSVGPLPSPRRPQESCTRTRATEVQPVHKAANKNQISHRNQQRWTSSAPVNISRHTGYKTGTAESLNEEQEPEQELEQELDSDQELHLDQELDQVTEQQSNSWITEQCLNLEGDRRRLIRRLLSRLFRRVDVQSDGHSEDQQPDIKLVVSMLVHLSGHTTLVRSMLAEHLNRPEWQNRRLACKTLSSLRGPINKDVVHKLVQLMRGDHSDRVRLAAAETLVSLGKMQDVQNQIRWKLEGELGLQGKMEALDLIISLKLMTVKLQESFVSCFKDEFPSVRKQACVTAALLQLKDETVVSRLLELVENDPSHEVRLSAITAVGALASSSADVQETLLRCVDTEKDAKLRLAASQLLQGVDVLKTKVQNFLEPRTKSESGWLLCRTMKENVQQKHSNAQNINTQVKPQCEWRVIADKVLLLEKLQDEHHQGHCLGPKMLAQLLGQQYTPACSAAAQQC